MIVTAEAVLPLGITAVAATGGDHTTKHAHWGYYMIAAVAAQVFTGWMRTKGLKAEHSNFSFLHRVRVGREGGPGEGGKGRRWDRGFWGLGSSWGGLGLGLVLGLVLGLDWG